MSKTITIKNLSFLFLVIIVVGCSTMSKASFYSGLVGSLLGGTLGLITGQALSPPGKFNETANAALGATIGVATGGVVGASLGRYFYGENPENRELKQMIRTDKDIPLVNIGVGDQEILINAQMQATKKYDMPTEKLPEIIRKKMKKPVVIEHNVKEQFIELPNNQGLYVPEFKVMEQTFEENKNE